MMRIDRHLSVAFVLLSTLMVGITTAADWPQYRGPTHDGIATESLALPWPASGPKLVWKAPTPNGFSSFTVSGGEVFTLVSGDMGGATREFCVALNAATGKGLWATATDRAEYARGGDSGAVGNNGGDGPRSTPVVSEGLVYVYTPHLVLYCLDAHTGKQVWMKDLIKENGGRNIGWNNAASPLVEGNLLFVAAGGKGQSLLGINKKTGQVVWKTGNDEITHATPVITTILDQRQVIFFTQKGLVSVTPDAGKELWRYPFTYSTSTAASPVVCGDIVYCSAGYDVGGGACRIAKTGNGFSASEIWRITGNKFVANHWSTPVFKDGYLYGMFSFKRYGVGPLKCVEAATGKIMWEQKGFGAGNVILAKDKLLALADDGELIAVDPNPQEYKEISRFQAIAGKCWSTPALSDGKIYVRSTKEGACFEDGGK